MLLAQSYRRTFTRVAARALLLTPASATRTALMLTASPKLGLQSGPIKRMLILCAPHAVLTM